MRWGRVAAAGSAAVAVRLFAFPRCDSPAAADAVVALDGDRPRRLRAAVALASDRFAPVLVVVYGESSAPDLLAASLLPFEVVSVVPEPSTTRGEARVVAELARERKWRRLLVVTSTYHVTRTRMIFERAIDCEVRVLAAGMSRRELPFRVLSEGLKMVLALTWRRPA